MVGEGRERAGRLDIDDDGGERMDLGAHDRVVAVGREQHVVAGAVERLHEHAAVIRIARDHEHGAPITQLSRRATAHASASVS